MHSKSKTITKQMTERLTAIEVFRALLKARDLCDIEMQKSISRSISHDKLNDVNKLSALYMEKREIYISLLLLKCFNALSFYNSVMLEMCGLDSPKDNLDYLSHIMEDSALELNLQTRMNELDDASGKELNTDEMHAFWALDLLSSQWFRIIIKMSSGESVPLFTEEFEKVKTNLEQLIKKYYSKEI